MTLFNDTAALLREMPALCVALAVLVGLLVGSFLNVVIYRLPKMMERSWRAECAELAGQPVETLPTFNLIVPRSRCGACERPIRAIENIPIVSYVVMRGRCACGKNPIGIRYPIVEGLTGLLSGVVAWRFGATAATLAALLFCWCMVALTFIDLDTFLLPDSITLPLLWLGLLLAFVPVFTDLRSAVAGAAAGYLALWCVYWAFKLATGKEGMGYGDFKLLGAIGAWFGWQMLPAVILLSAVAGAVIGIAMMIVSGKGRDMRIPFGPYLACAGVAALLFGPAINNAYLGLFAR